MKVGAGDEAAGGQGVTYSSKEDFLYLTVTKLNLIRASGPIVLKSLPK